MQCFENFYAAMQNENLSEIEKLIDAGFDLNIPDEEGATAIFYSILQGNIDIVSYLLEKGANADFTADEPAASILTEKPLELAQQLRFLTDWEKYHPIVKLLVRYGGKDFAGRTDVTEEKLIEIKERAKQEGLGTWAK